MQPILDIPGLTKATVTGYLGSHDEADTQMILVEVEKLNIQLPFIYFIFFWYVYNNGQIVLLTQMGLIVSEYFFIFYSLPVLQYPA